MPSNILPKPLTEQQARQRSDETRQRFLRITDPADFALFALGFLNGTNSWQTQPEAAEAFATCVESYLICMGVR